MCMNITHYYSNHIADYHNQQCLRVYHSINIYINKGRQFHKQEEQLT